MIDLETLLRVPCVELEMGFDISPDGQRVAFSWNPEGHWEIYEIFLRFSYRWALTKPSLMMSVHLPEKLKKLASM